VLSKVLKAEFYELSGVKSKKEDLNQILERANQNKAYGTKTILFLDEIHRRNKAQQDSLLPFVESGLITLIGATTENPSFTINNALLSRCKVLVFEPLTEENVFDFFKKSEKKILNKYPNLKLNDEILKTISSLAN
jgi:putative ATPase